MILLLLPALVLGLLWTYGFSGIPRHPLARAAAVALAVFLVGVVWLGLVVGSINCNPAEGECAHSAPAKTLPPL